MSKSRHFSQGEIIIRENDIGESAYVIEHGRVKVTKKRGGRDVFLAELGPGGTIGEMSMIDEKPRSATVVALEDCDLREVHRNEFSDALRSDPETGLRLLRVIFERLREADARIAEFVALVQSVDDATPAPVDTANLTAVLEPVTREANILLPDGPLTITRFPFRIGRPSRDPLVHNDLALDCPKPFQVSRHHVSIIRSEGRIGVLDRGSARGSTVDDRRLGGPDGATEPLFFGARGGKLRLGDKDSPICFYLRPQQRVAIG